MPAAGPGLPTAQRKRARWAAPAGLASQALQKLMCLRMGTCGSKGWNGYLYPVFRQLRLHGQHLPGINIWVVGLIERLLQLLQLVGGEDRPEGAKPDTQDPRKGKGGSQREENGYPVSADQTPKPG